MADVIESLKDADMVVFASPIYWFDIAAQEKAAIDRLYAFGATGFPSLRRPFCSTATVKASMMRRSLCTSPHVSTASGGTRALSPSAS